MINIICLKRIQYYYLIKYYVTRINGRNLSWGNIAQPTLQQLYSAVQKSEVVSKHIVIESLNLNKLGGYCSLPLHRLTAQLWRSLFVFAPLANPLFLQSYFSFTYLETLLVVIRSRPP